MEPCLSACHAHILHHFPCLPRPAPPLQVDSLSPELLRKRVSFEDFLNVYHIQRKLHTLTVALDFFHQV